MYSFGKKLHVIVVARIFIEKECNDYIGVTLKIKTRSFSAHFADRCTWTNYARSNINVTNRYLYGGFIRRSIKYLIRIKS